MWRSPTSLVGRAGRLGMARFQILDSGYASTARALKLATELPGPFSGVRDDKGQQNDQALSRHSEQDDVGAQALSRQSEQDGGNYVPKKESLNCVPKKERFNYLVSTLRDLKDSKEDVYGTLDALVASEEKFPIASLKRALLVLEEEKQWHRIVQVIKWMLSKGQGTTMATYRQLIHALDMDNRAEEAHQFWIRMIVPNLNSVPWSLCQCMISIYYRNNMLQKLVKLFKGLEALNRVPPDASIVQNVADAYEMLGRLDEKTKVLEKYNYLFKKKKSVSQTPGRSLKLD